MAKKYEQTLRIPTDETNGKLCDQEVTARTGIDPCYKSASPQRLGKNGYTINGAENLVATLLSADVDFCLAHPISTYTIPPVWHTPGWYKLTPRSDNDTVMTHFGSQWACNLLIYLLEPPP
jgi:hypothetical protein